MRLDRFVCCSDWELFPEALLQSAAAGVSDHCPLTLGLQVQIPKKKRFHFESFWPKLPGSLEAVSQNWDAPVSTICSVECVFLKLQRLNKGLQGWSKRKVGNVRLQLAMAKEILHHLGIARYFRGLSAGEDWLRQKLKQHCLSLAFLERTIARLRSRILYLWEGDANTSFFHQQARYRKRKNFIGKLQVGDLSLTAQEDKQQAALDFFDNLIGTAEQRSYTMDFNTLGIQQHDLHDLDAPFTIEEVWAVVKELPLDKVCWDIIKKDIMAALVAVHKGHISKFKLLNTTFITLLNNKVDALQDRL